jgi:hypothetical protein
LGFNSAEELKKHPWMADFPWQDLESKKLKAPVNMADSHGYNCQYIDEAWTDTNSPDFIESLQSLDSLKVQQLFLGYYFDFRLVLQTRSNKYTQL